MTAEYNHGIPAVLKNALDYAYPEWNKKAAGFVGYGSVGGARAIEQLRLVPAELQLATIRTGVLYQGADFMAVWKEGKDLKDITHLQPASKTCWTSWSGGPRRSRSRAIKISSPRRPKLDVSAYRYWADAITGSGMSAIGT